MTRRCIFSAVILIILVASPSMGRSEETPAIPEQARAKELNAALVRSILADDMAGVTQSLESGANANPPDGMPIGAAVSHGNIEIAKLLLAHGASAEPLNHCCVLYRAVCAGRAPMVKFLLDAGARQGLDLCMRVAARAEHADVLILLIGAGANVNSRGAGGETALHIAARTGRTESVKILIQSGCDPCCRDRKDQLPVDYARANHHPDIVRIFLANAAT